MGMLVAIILSMLALSATALPRYNKDEHAAVVDKLDIAPVWAGDPVPFALLTQAPYQYIAYYDANREMTVVQRNLNERTWRTNKLNITTGWDSHNYIAMAIDDDGYLHISGNMHAAPLVYLRTSQPRDASTFVKLNKMDIVAMVIKFMTFMI
jgi:hypothetical protein